MIKVSKYEFASESVAQAAIDSLPHVEVEGENVPNHKHTIVKLGHIVIQDGIYDENGEETQAPVLSENYHVDVLWKDIQEVDEEGNVSFAHPSGWAVVAAIDIDNEGMHGFMGVSYQENKNVMAKISEDTNVTLDLKTIGIIVGGAISLASMYFALKSDIAANKRIA